MSAFDSWSDEIERTPPGQPYVVDSSGWGWFMLFYLAALPFIVLSVLIEDFAKWYAEHLILCLIIFALHSCIIGILLYRRRNYKHRVLGVIASLLTTAPLACFMTRYLIPFVILEPGFDAVFDFILIILLLFGGQVLVFSLCRLFKNGLAHLFLSALFIGVSFLLLIVAVNSEKDLLTFDAILSLYR